MTPASTLFETRTFIGWRHHTISNNVETMERSTMTDDTSKNRKEGIAGRIKNLFAPESDCGCGGGCCGNVKIVPKKTDEKKE
jgi:hypothetical protein